MGTGADRAPVAVLGAGAMGTQLAYQIALHGHPVRLWSRSRDRAGRSMAQCRQLLGRLVERHRMDATQCERAIAAVCPADTLAQAVVGSAVVVESVAEDRDLKRRLLSETSTLVAPDTILATNSSTIPASALTPDVRGPERLVNCHFFNPPLLVRLVEVVRGPHVRDEILDRVTAFVRSIDRVPIVVEKEGFGFIVNRLLFMGVQQALAQVEAGLVTIPDCDAQVVAELRWPLGPFAIADLVGLDVVTAILEEGWQQTGEGRWRPGRLLADHTDRGMLGRKTGGGFLP